MAPLFEAQYLKVIRTTADDFFRRNTTKSYAGLVTNHSKRLWNAFPPVPGCKG